MHVGSPSDWPLLHKVWCQIYPETVRVVGVWKCHALVMHRVDCVLTEKILPLLAEMVESPGKSMVQHKVCH